MHAVSSIGAIGFDLDQTLCPREQAFWSWIERECAAAPGHNLSHARVAELDARGRGPKPSLLAYLAETLGWQETSFARRHERFVEGCASVLTPDPALLAMLGRLAARYPLALISNGSSRAQRKKLVKLALDTWLSPVLISEEVGYKKPAPEIFQRLVHAWQLAPEAIAFVGDDPEADVLAARAVGMTPIWISAGRAWSRVEPAPTSVERVHELEALLLAMEEPDFSR